MPPSKASKIELFIEAYIKSWGSIAYALQASGLKRGTYDAWRNRDKGFQQKLEEANKYLVDEARKALGRNIEKGISTDIQFFLKHKAREEFGDGLSLDIEAQKYEKLAEEIFGESCEP